MAEVNEEPNKVRAKNVKECKSEENLIMNVSLARKQKRMNVIKNDNKQLRSSGQVGEEGNPLAILIELHYLK